MLIPIARHTLYTYKVWGKEIHIQMKTTLQYSKGKSNNFDIGTPEEMQRAKKKYEKEGYICLIIENK